MQIIIEMEDFLEVLTYVLVKNNDFTLFEKIKLV